MPVFRYNFGPCDPCGRPRFPIGETINFVQLSVKDDDDLEFDHGFIVELNVLFGILPPTPLQINITDDGTCVSVIH